MLNPGRLLTVVSSHLICGTFLFAMPEAAQGQRMIREPPLASPPDRVLLSFIDPPRISIRGRTHFAGEIATGSPAAPVMADRFDPDLGSSFQRARVVPVVGQIDQASMARMTFTTNFSLAENPISEGGVWQHRGTAWKYVRTVGDHAVGTQMGTGDYDDSYAYLTGFAPDQSARATLWIDPTTKGSYRELELLLHWADSPASARGYECKLSWNGSYAEIVRWNGPLGDFTYVTKQTRFDSGLMPPASGDIFTATIVGDLIRVWLNKNDGRGDRLIVTGRDSTFTDGDPGMGFFTSGSADAARFGFSGYAAWSN